MSFYYFHMLTTESLVCHYHFYMRTMQSSTIEPYLTACIILCYTINMSMCYVPRISGHMEGELYGNHGLLQQNPVESG